MLVANVGSVSETVFRIITEIHRVDNQVWVMETVRWRGEVKRRTPS